jgi:hypothetical protein
MQELTDASTLQPALRPTVVCAWCSTTMRQGAADQVSHGICFACRRTVLRTLGVLVQFADGLPARVLGRISDRGFELIRPRGETVSLDFSAIMRVDDETVILSCDERTMGTYHSA